MNCRNSRRLLAGALAWSGAVGRREFSRSLDNPRHGALFKLSRRKHQFRQRPQTRIKSQRNIAHQRGTYANLNCNSSGYSSAGPRYPSFSSMTSWKATQTRCNGTAKDTHGRWKSDCKKLVGGIAGRNGGRKEKRRLRLCRFGDSATRRHQ